MTARTNAQRQALLAARRRGAGLVRVSVWVHADVADLLRRYAAALQEARKGLSR